MGASWGPLRGLLGPPGRLLGPSWGALGAILEDIDQKTRGSITPAPIGGLKNCLLDPSWGALGALLGALGAVLGLSWAALGAFGGPLGAILTPRKAIESKKARRQKSLISLRFLKDFGLLAASWGHLEPSWGGLGASKSILGAILGNLEPSWMSSWALRGPLGAVLGHLGRPNAPRGAPSRSTGRG